MRAKALAISLWTTAEAAEAGTVDGRPLYEDQIETFTAIYRAAPGRETYRVALADTPAAPRTGSTRSSETRTTAELRLGRDPLQSR
jgi:hypothetical protein